MAEFKVTINDPKAGKSYSKAVSTSTFLNKMIRETVSGDDWGLAGYELEITGGSDAQGFPMRFDMPGAERRKALLTRGPGVHLDRDGQRKRKSVRGNTIGAQTVQVNLKVVKYGAKSIPDLLGIPAKEESAAQDGQKAKEATP